MITLFETLVPHTMRTHLIAFSVLLLTACSTTQLPISPHKIDVQQGNALEQDALDKLKPGLTRSQVRFLLGTPLVVDPFRDNRWDYVYNYRTAGKLTAEKRVTLFFDRDVLSRYEVDGVEQHPVQPAATAEAAPDVTASITPPVIPEPQPLAESVATKQTASQPEMKEVASETTQRVAATPVVVTAPVAVVTESPAKSTASTSKVRTKTSIVPPLEQGAAKSGVAKADTSVSSVALKNETDAEAIKPDVMPAFPEAMASSETETPVLSAVQNWARAWSARDEQGYLAAYAEDFKPTGGFTKAEWEKRRKLLLNLSKSIDVQVESPVIEFSMDGRALVTFNQYYRSDSYNDAVIKQLVMGLKDGHWLILEERVMSALKVKKQ